VQVVAVLLIGLAWRATAGRGPLEGFVAALANRARAWATAKPTDRRLKVPGARTRASMEGVVSTDEVNAEPVGSARTGREMMTPALTCRPSGDRWIRHDRIRRVSAGCG